MILLYFKLTCQALDIHHLVGLSTFPTPPPKQSMRSFSKAGRLSHGGGGGQVNLHLGSKWELDVLCLGTCKGSKRSILWEQPINLDKNNPGPQWEHTNSKNMPYACTQYLRKVTKQRRELVFTVAQMVREALVYGVSPGCSSPMTWALPRSAQWWRSFSTTIPNLPNAGDPQPNITCVATS